MTSPPAAVAEGDSVGGVTITEHGGTFYVVFALGQTFSFSGKLRQWLFYIMSTTYVLDPNCFKSEHAVVAAALVRLSGVPHNLLSPLAKRAVKRAYDIAFRGLIYGYDQLSF